MKLTILAAMFLCSAFAGETFRAGANVVLIDATVLDRHQRPVRGLTRESFRLYEDKVEQHISYFGEEELPLSLVVVFDASGSMGAKIAGAARALGELLADPREDDEFSLVTFADRAEMRVAWTAETGDIRDSVRTLRAGGNTALLDAVDVALGALRTVSKKRRRAVLIVSDGGDNQSRRSERAISRVLEEADVQVYAVDVTSAMPRGRSDEEVAGPDLLERLCERAGGRYFQVDDQRELETAARQISREMRSQYVVGYGPSNGAADGLFRHVRLQLMEGKGLAVYWRRGYRAPGR